VGPCAHPSSTLEHYTLICTRSLSSWEINLLESIFLHHFRRTELTFRQVGLSFTEIGGSAEGFCNSLGGSIPPIEEVDLLGEGEFVSLEGWRMNPGGGRS
jgi:hypothetical protein